MNSFSTSVRHLITVTLWDIAAFCGIKKLALVVPTGVMYKNGEEGSCEDGKECGNCGDECGCDK